MNSYYPTIRVSLDSGATMPVRKHDTDAGADIYTRETLRVPPHGSVLIDTGVHVELPENTKGEIMTRSSLNINNDIITTGLIDEGFTGEIKVKLYNLGDKWQVFNAGERIAQLVVSPVCYPDYVEAERISGGERGDGGFGSTGR